MQRRHLLLSLLSGGAIAAAAPFGPGIARSASLRAVPIVGLPCEGCEAVFEGLPEQIPARSRIAPADEPGEPMLLAGRVIDAQGRPRSGIVIYAYQTDRKGIYPDPGPPAGSEARRHGRLRGWAMSDAQGGYAFSTIRPGAYPDTDMPQHIHMHVIEPGCATYYIDDVMFRDDPRLTAGKMRTMVLGRGGGGLVTPFMEDGVWQVERDIVLGMNIPGHPRCSAP